MRATLFVFLIFFMIPLAGQDQAGTYVDGLGDLPLTSLQLRADGTFMLEQSDPVFTNDFTRYTSEGTWISSGDTVWLNPTRAPLIPEVKLVAVPGSPPPTDSIIIDIDYKLRSYASNDVVESSAYPFSQVTVFVDKRRRGYNLVSDPIIRHCLFAPRVKRQVTPNAKGAFRIPISRPPARIGILTYGFQETIWLPAPPGTHYRLCIDHPVAADRAPRRKAVIIRKDKAYFYEVRGKIPTNGLLTPLRKITK